MFPLVSFLSLRSLRDWSRLAALPVVWVLTASLCLHLFSFQEQTRTEQRVQSMKEEFRQWWEYGGKTMLTIQGIDPEDTREYQKRLDDRIEGYTSQTFRYQLQLVPATAQVHQFFSAWLLQPGFASLLLFLWFYSYAGLWLEERWGRLKNLGIFVLSCAMGNALVYVIAGILYHKYLDLPFTGASSGLAVAMGALLATHSRESVEMRVPGKASLSWHLPAWALVIAWFLADALVNWFVNPGLYKAVVPVNLLLLPCGIFLGLRMPLRRKGERELKREQLELSLAQTYDIAQDERTTHRTCLADGFAAAHRREYQGAHELLVRGLNGLLRESPVDEAVIAHAVERLVHPDLLLDISANQWLEWGNQLSRLRMPQSSIFCLERNLAQEKDERFARMALLLSGAQRIKYQIDAQKGRQLLEKVISLKSDDLHAKRAADMLAKYPAP